MNNLRNTISRKRKYNVFSDNHIHIKKKRKLNNYNNNNIYTINNKNNEWNDNDDNNNNGNTNIKGRAHYINDSNELNANDMMYLEHKSRYTNYKNKIKHYYIHDDMFLNIDQIIIELLCTTFPKEISIIINEYNNLQFSDIDINKSIQHSNALYLLWNDYYYQLNQLNLPIHDQYCCIQYKYGVCCIPCKDLYFLNHKANWCTHTKLHNGLLQKEFYYSYNDKQIQNYLNISK